MIGVFDCAARLVETMATPAQAIAMPSHIVGVGAVPNTAHSIRAATGGVS